MRLTKRKPSGREIDEESVELLEKLREQLYLSNLTVMRQTAFNLSWMQEDGLEILEEAIFSDSSRKTKVAAAYGLRKMRGRMRKPARDLLEKGAKDTKSGIAFVCKNALSVLDGTHVPRKKSYSRKFKPKFEIRDIPGRSPRRSTRPRHNARNFNR
ncbi:hypothetical protein ACFL3F_02545 [Planctomycetota bacterium]